MAERCKKKDKIGNEWMSASQYKRALKKDFNVVTTVQTIYTACVDFKIGDRHCQTLFGKKAYNYTQSVIAFLEMSPKLMPNKFKDKVKKFKEALKESALKTLPASTISREDSKSLGDDSDDEDDLSVSEEKAKHERIKRERAQFEFDVIKGNYLDIETVGAILQTVAIETRQSMHSIRPRIRGILAAKTSEHEIDLLLGTEIDASLDHLTKLDEITDGTFEEAEEKRRQKDEGEEK